MWKDLYNISTVVIADKDSKNLFELTSRYSPNEFVASDDLKRALQKSPPTVRAAFEKVFLLSNHKLGAGGNAGSRRQYKMKKAPLLIVPDKVENCSRK